jgi:hypothetical protein
MRILSAVIFAVAACECAHTVTADAPLCGTGGYWGYWAIDVPLTVVSCVRIAPAQPTRGETSPGAVVSCRQVDPSGPWVVMREDGSMKQHAAPPEACSHLLGDASSAATEAGQE